MRSDVTVIAAACNEESQVAAWLETVRWAERVVVVDTGSRDGTIAALEAAGVEVLRMDVGAPESVTGVAVVHAAKNLAIDQVRSGWILDLDLDERVPDALADEIRRVTDRDGAGPIAYAIPFRHYVFGRWLQHGGWRGAHRRLYRAGCARYPEDRAHSTLEVDGEIGELEQFVVHFAHPTIHEFLVKMNRYTSHDAPLIAAHGRGGLRNRPPLPVSRWAWSRAALSVFWNRYIKARGFRDGVAGFIVAVALAMYIFVEQLKVWELRNVVDDREPEDPRAGALA
ncbi:MAG: glycosyltransferase family 2 protein [Planctomycetes bacterium]|nr:glycosyltransferase family 2 protein [Planctomycetota bacterium]